MSSNPKMPGQMSSPVGQARQQILSQLLLDPPFLMPGGTQFADGAGLIVR